MRPVSVVDLRSRLAAFSSNSWPPGSYLRICRRRTDLPAAFVCLKSSVSSSHPAAVPACRLFPASDPSNAARATFAAASKPTAIPLKTSKASDRHRSYNLLPCPFSEYLAEMRGPLHSFKNVAPTTIRTSLSATCRPSRLSRLSPCRR